MMRRGPDLLPSSLASERPRPEPGAGVPKVFGIGLSRTGTTSLTDALERLGFPAIHYPTRFSQIEAHAAATDIPVSLSFRKLDRLFPGSRFILTLRPLEPWLESCERLWKKRGAAFARNPNVMEIEKRFYGGSGYDRQLYTAARDRHLAEVGTYFRERPDDLLLLDLFDDADPWQSLCPFLRVPRPGHPFPHQNKSAAVDYILLCLMEDMNDVAEVARLTRTGEDYLIRLASERAGMVVPDALLSEGRGEEVRILKWSCAALGATRVAKLLGLDSGRLEAYLGGALEK
jgi:Sulfotransferase domain